MTANNDSALAVAEALPSVLVAAGGTGGHLFPAEALAAALAGVPGVRHVDLVAAVNGHARCRVEAAPGCDPRPDLAERVAAGGWRLLVLAPVETSLEEAFLALVGGREAGA